MTRTEITAKISDQVARYYTSKRFAVFKEFGLCKRGSLRADFIAINMKRQIVIIEVKSCAADFQTDHKWQRYLPYCNKFYFAMNYKTYKQVKDKIPSGIGVMLFGEGYLATVEKRSTSRNMDDQHLLEVLTRLAYRQADYNRYKYVRKV